MPLTEALDLLVTCCTDDIERLLDWTARVAKLPPSDPTYADESREVARYAARVYAQAVADGDRQLADTAAAAQEAAVAAQLDL